MKRAQLPFIDPTGALVILDPEELDDYACGLLAQWRAGGTKAYSKTLVKKAAVSLIAAYADARVPLSQEASLLIQEIIQSNTVKYDHNSACRPVRKANEKSYWAALFFEAANPGVSASQLAHHVRVTVGFPNLGTRSMRKPDGADNSEILRKTAESLVTQWRKRPDYRENLKLQRVIGAALKKRAALKKPSVAE
jgi:hypothetical protein